MKVDSNTQITTNQFSNEEEEQEKVVTKVSKFHGWHSNGNDDNSSRIFRVSRATGGKDRHSKVLTSKGLRDRRVRLSVSTAIAFYDLQDRLGYDQPSKAVEWLIKASQEAIAELPELTTPFSSESASFLLNKKQQKLQFDADLNPNSGLSLSRPDEIRANRVKASRERARESTRAAKEKEMRIGDLLAPQNQTLASSQQNASFTELLTSGLLFSTAQPMVMSPPFASTPIGDNHNCNQHRHQHQHHSSSPELQQQQHFTTNDMQHYDLNFRMSPSSSDCFDNRGTLQSNLSAPSLFQPHHQFPRFSSEDGLSNNNHNNDGGIPFFFGAMASAAPSSSVSSENNDNTKHHPQQQHLQQDHYSQYDAGFGGRLQLINGDGTPHCDQKGKN